MLTAEQIAKRRFSIGGSDANTIMGGNAEAIHALWEIKLGKREPDDLSWVLPVQFGHVTEDLNRRWYAHETGHEVTQAGKECTHAEHSFLTCTLDGIVFAKSAVFEAKCVNAFSNIDETAQKYMGQLHHNMAVTGLKRSVLSIFIGTLKYDHLIVDADPFYSATLLENELAFWASVQGGKPPGDLQTIATPQVGPVKLRTVDMKGNNAWASHAADWLKHKDGAKAFETAAKELKGLMATDMGEAFGGGLKISRAKNGSLTIRESK
jgi:predicted phage-related endonuclease